MGLCHGRGYNSHAMNAAKTLLWIQLVLAIAGTFVAFAYVHWGATSVEWARRYEVEWEKSKQSPDYHEPPTINDRSFARVVDGMQTDARARLHIAGYWFFSCALSALLAAVMLWLLRGSPLTKSRRDDRE